MPHCSGEAEHLNLGRFGAGVIADNLLQELARITGIAVQWRDVEGRENVVCDRVLAGVLEALGHDVSSAAGLTRASAQQLDTGLTLAPMLVAKVGETITLPFAPANVEATDEDGHTLPLTHFDKTLTAPDRPGYYQLAIDGEQTVLAVAPPRCPPVSGGGRSWGVSLQIPSLRNERGGAFGTLGELATMASGLGRAGADAVAINPLHALFPGQGENFSPYSPSSRLYANTMMGDPTLVGLPPLPEGEGGALIDWPNSVPLRFAQMRALFDGLKQEQRAAVDFAQAEQDRRLYRHCLFDAIDMHYRPKGARGWQDWPDAMRHPDSALVAEFAAAHQEDIDFQIFLQWLAQESAGKAQKSALVSGMDIGLIGDLAVGVDPGGSDCWQLGEAMLQGLTVGAPPDPFSPTGQNWALTTYSPHGLRAAGYEPFIAMLRAGFTSCGGLRIDHAFGLGRLWVVPKGCAATEGAYLAYPQEDLLNLVTLEAHRAAALVIAEDLGTAPPGFTHAITQRGMLGMQVLWFQRAQDDGFIGAQDYSPGSVAMTGTHDTPTLAGWWSGRDIDWAEDLGRLPDGVDRGKAESLRDWDRGLLWSTLDHNAPRPAPGDTAPLVDAAIAHCARTPAPLAIVPIEDMLGLEEQPNLPGTVTEHPNWRRRLAANVDEVLAAPQVEHRIDLLNRERKRS